MSVDIWSIIRHRMSKVSSDRYWCSLSARHLRNATLTGECTSARSASEQNSLRVRWVRAEISLSFEKSFSLERRTKFGFFEVNAIQSKHFQELKKNVSITEITEMTNSFWELYIYPLYLRVKSFCSWIVSCERGTKFSFFH